MDGAPVWENPEVKERIAYVADELFLPANGTLKSMAQLYRSQTAAHANAAKKSIRSNSEA